MVRVKAVSVNRVYDTYTRKGKYRPDSVTFPLVLGVDPVGVVVKTGIGVSSVQVGARVAVISRIPCGRCERCMAGKPRECRQPNALAIDRWGGYAEYISVPEASVYEIPDALSCLDATVIARPFPVAYNLLLDQAQLQPGEWVLVMGASGALAISGIQVAKLHGATVIGAAGAPERVDIARRYGADYGIDYRSQDLEKEVLKITRGRGVDVVFENVGADALWSSAFNCLARNGRLVTAGSHGGRYVTLDVRKLYMDRIRVIGAVGALPRHIEMTLDNARSGRIRPIPYRVMALKDAARAHQLLETDRSAGKIVLDAEMI